MGCSQAPDRRDVAADTVIGFVLVTGISLVMISVVMLMGAPALEQVQSHQQTDSMIGAFQRLDRGVSTLISGSPAGTAPAWQVSMADGSLSVDDGGDHLWGYVANLHREGNDYEFWFGEYADGDDQLVIHNDGHGIGTDEFQVQAIRHDGDDEATRYTFSRGTLANGDSITLDESGFWDLEGHTTQLKLFDLGNDDPDRPVAQAWFIDGGAVEWELNRGGTMRQVLYQNTAIIAVLDGGEVLHNSPRLRAPDDSSDGKEDIFVRVVKMEGAASLGGRSSSEMLLSGQGNHARHSHGNVSQFQLYPPTSTIVAWERHLTNEQAGFTYSWTDDHDVFVGDEAAAHYKSSDKLSTTLVETGVVMSRSGGR